MMMKWGRRRASSSASKHSFSPISWLSKLKRKGGDTGREPVKGKGKGERNSDSQSFSWPESWNDGRFCGGDDDSFWRISFGEERFEGETSSRVGLRSVWYGSDDELEVVPVFGSKNSKLKETPKFNEMVLDIRKMRELNRNSENSPEIVARKGERPREGKKFKMLRRKAAKDKKSNRRDLEGKRREMERESDKAEEKLMVGEEKVIFELEPTKKIQTTEGTLLRTIEEDYVFEALNLEKNNRFSKEDMKIKELMSKIENERKSVYINRELQSGKVRVSYPRTVTKIECKIKAIEDMKRGKLKKKKKRKKKKEREVEEERTAFDNFAMVKCSYNPEQDFRDSMVEMIREKRIRRPEELEELLACYLTLNSDEYHDLIIKVFRHVWFDLDEACFEPEL